MALACLILTGIKILSLASSKQEIENKSSIHKTNTPTFPSTAPAANPVFYRTYSRKTPLGRESWDQVSQRNLEGLSQLGKLSNEEVKLMTKMQTEKKALPSGRWLWIGGTEWINKEDNFSGAYNCTSTNLDKWESFGLMMDLAMMGCGTGAIIEPQFHQLLEY